MIVFPALRTTLESRYFIPGCFGFFVLLRVLLIWGLPVAEFSDAEVYLHRGINIATGNGYYADGHPTAYWPVGYPALLGLLFFVFGQDQLVAQLANLAFACASFFLVLKLGEHLFRSENTARLAVLLFALYPNNAAYAPLVMTEVFFSFLLLLGGYLYMVKRGWWWIVAIGLIFGFAALTKPQSIFIPGFLVLLSLLFPRQAGPMKTSILKGVVIYLAMASMLVPWAVRNTTTFGELVLISTNGGITLLTGNNPSALGGLTPDDDLVRQVEFTVKDQVAADRHAKQLAVQWIKDNPWDFVGLIPFKIWHLWYKDGEGEWFYQGGYEHYDDYWYLFRAVRIANQIYYVLLILGLLISIPLVYTRRETLAWPWVLFGYILVAYITVISSVFSGQSRFHFPVMPWVIMYTAWIASVYLSSRRDRAQDLGRVSGGKGEGGKPRGLDV